MVSYTLFYSKKCSHSRQYIRYLEQFPNINALFKKICTDDIHINPNVKVYIKKYKIDRVPTIIINNNKYYGYDAFKWLEHNANEISSVYPSLNKQDYSQIMNQQTQSITADNTGFPPLDDSRGQSLFGNSDNLMDYNNQDSINIQANNPIPQQNINQAHNIPEALKPIDCKAPGADMRDILEQYQSNRNNDIKVATQVNNPYMYK